ncbi:MAG TPA: transposase [Streptosporangiaceae bacterium]
MTKQGLEAAAAAGVAAGLGRRKRTELLMLMRPAFTRTEAWLQAARYTAAVMSDLPRRNGWTIAKLIGDRTPDRTQRLLNRACWDEAAAMSAVRRFAVAGLDEAARRSGRSRGLAVGALDETGQEKHDQATAGVQRQHMGCAGGVENGINTVHLFLCPRGYRARADRRPPVDPARADQRPGPVAADGPAAGPSVRDQRRAGQGDRRRRAR